MLYVGYNGFGFLYCLLHDLSMKERLNICFEPVFGRFRKLDSHDVAQDRSYSVGGLLVVYLVVKLKDRVVLRLSLRLP